MQKIIRESMGLSKLRGTSKSATRNVIGQYSKSVAQPMMNDHQYSTIKESTITPQNNLETLQTNDAGGQQFVYTL